MEQLIKRLCANILTVMNSSLSEKFVETVLNRLVSFGCCLKEEDDWAICFAMQKVENHIKNSCNTTSVPDGLFYVAVDMACGEFLFSKKQTGKLKLADMDLTGAVASISEGDTSITFAAGASDEDKLNVFINYLLHNKEGEFVCYRQLKW